MKEQIDRKYECVMLDKQGLVTALAEVGWCSETKSQDQKLLYDDKGEVVEEWASRFWSLYSGYEALTESYIKTEACDTNKEESTGRPEGPDK
jgi:hypothetical protein